MTPPPRPTHATHDGTRAPSGAWLAVGLLCLVACLNYLDRVMLTTMRESITGAIPMTDAQFGLLSSVFLWVYGVCSPLAGFLADRVSRARLITVSLLLWSLTTWLTAYCVRFDQLLATRALMGVCEACYMPAAMALIADYHRGGTRSLAVGVHNSGVSLGSALGGLGGWLAERQGWSFAFSLFGILGVVYTVALMWGLRDAPKAAPAQAGPDTEEPRPGPLFILKSLFSSRSYWLLMLHWGLMGLASWGAVGWMPTYLQQQFHLQQGSAGLYSTFSLQAATVVGLVVGGLLADRWSRRHPRGRVFVAICGVCLAAPAIFLTASTPVLAASLSGLMLFGFARAWADGNTMPILCLFCDSRHRATAFGVLNLFSCCVGGLTIYAGGVLRDANVDVGTVFRYSALGLLLCGALLAFIRPAAQAEHAPIPFSKKRV